MISARTEPLVQGVIRIVLAFLLVLTGPAFAHGPDGDHGAQPIGAGAARVATPRFEAATDLFELVVALAGGELSILIDRFETNAPVLEAAVEVESAGRRATARYRADRGDYVVDDTAFLSVVAGAGEHAFVITVATKDESDLLNGTLAVGDAMASTSAAWHAHGEHDHALEGALFAAAGVVLLVLIVVLWRRMRRKRQRSLGTPQQVQS